MRQTFLLTLVASLSITAVVACGSATTPSGATSSPTPEGSATPTPSGTATPSGSATPTPSGTPVANSCVSNFNWVLGDFGSSWMHPGLDCVGCHATSSGPDLWLGGTVYAADGQLDDCGGVSGVQIDVTDANGTVTSLTSGPTGNFFLKKSDAPGFTAPYSVKLSINGAERSMSASQTDGGCNSCHTQTGANGAPGRILEPGL